MSFFRDYLQRQKQEPDLSFKEADENWFVFALLLLRLGFSYDTWKLITGRGTQFLYDDPLAKVSPGPDFGNAIRFVSTFLCFFVPKPPRYRAEIGSFKNYFITGFVESGQKQALLFVSALPSFSAATLEVAKWETVSDYFRPVAEGSGWENPNR